MSGDGSTTHVFACAQAALGTGQALTVKLAPSPEGRPREAVLVRDVSGQARAYRNLCRHLPIPLDAGSRVFLNGSDLVCATHGARYRVTDGVCIAGPCVGAVLLGMPIEMRGDELFVVDLDRSDQGSG